MKDADGLKRRRPPSMVILIRWHGFSFDRRQRSIFNWLLLISCDKASQIVVDKEPRRRLRKKQHECGEGKLNAKIITRSLLGERICTFTFSVRGGCSRRFAGCSCHSRRLFGGVAFEIDLVLSNPHITFDQHHPRPEFFSHTSTDPFVTVWGRRPTASRRCWW